MKKALRIQSLIIIFLIAAIKPAMASGKPYPGIKINYSSINRLMADTTLPEKDEKTKEEKKKENATSDQQTEVVKVIPNARRQAIPLPVKVNVHPVKIIKPKIKAVVKPVIKILH